MRILYFQTPDIKPQYCEIGTYCDDDPDYIYYLDEPCKVLIDDVKIIDKKNTRYNEKERLHYVINQ